MLNNLFFNTNNTTLKDLEQFALTKDNCEIILEALQPNKSFINESTKIIPLIEPLEIQEDNEKQEINSIDNCNNANKENYNDTIIIIENPEIKNLEIKNLEIENIVKTKKSTFFNPRQQDTLFWCIYILMNGFNEYNEIQRNYGVVELDIKKKIADFLKDNQSKMKNTNYKITKVAIQEIMSELLTSQKMTSYECLIAMCVFYKINIIIVYPNDKIMLEFISSNDEEIPFFILYKDVYGKYKVNTEKKSWKEVQEMKQTRVCLDNYLKPMKSISNYTIPYLEELATKLGVLDLTKKYKKVELYDLINNSMKPVGMKT
jgi:hypothetical protein